MLHANWEHFQIMEMKKAKGYNFPPQKYSNTTVLFYRP